MAETQQLSQLLAQVEDFVDQRAVVELAGVRPLIRGAGAVGGIQLFAQSAVVGVGHHRVITGELQADQPAVQLLGRRGLRHLCLGRVGKAGQRRLIADVLSPRLSGIQQLIGEAAGQLRQLHLNRAITLLTSGRQVDAGQTEVTQRVFKNSLLRHVKTGGLRAAGQGLVSLEQAPVLADFSPVFR